MSHRSFFILFCVLGFAFISSPPVMAQAQDPVPQSPIPQDREQIRLSYAPLVKQVAPAVVNIFSERTVTRQSPLAGDPFFEFFFGQGLNRRGLNRQRVESALGSGAIVDPTGLVVTNAHVVEGAEAITVILPDGREFSAEKQLTDKPSDLAILKIEPGETPLPYIRLEPSERLEVGDLVLAIGNPFGVGQTVTSGIVSALARSSLDINDFNFFIQTDAAINPGNSGGPLVAMDGGVVGINTAIFSRSGGSLGIGFAVPSEMVATVVAAAQAGQSGDNRIIRPWLGIEAQKVTADIAASLDLPAARGVLISALSAASPAKEAGLRVGDVVLAVNEKNVRDPAEMKFRTATVPLGAEARFEVLQKGKKRDLYVKAMPPPEEPPRNETRLTGTHPLAGATVSQINPAVAFELNLKTENGVVVTNVESYSPATRFVRPGDIIQSMGEQEIDTVDTLEDTLRQTGEARQGWRFILSRNGRSRQVIFR